MNANKLLNGLLALVLMAGTVAGCGLLPGSQAQPEDIYQDPEGTFSLPIPKDWQVEQEDGYARVTGPEGGVTAYVLSLPETDPEAAIAQAWERIDPSFDLPVRSASERPADEGMESAYGIDYETGDDDRYVLASTQLYQGRNYLFILDTSLAAAQKRSSQLNLLFTGMQVSGLETVDLSGEQPRKLDAAMLAELETYVQETMEQYGVPGAAVAVVQDGEIVFSRGFGVRNLQGDPVTADTQMMIGSTSKTMSTMMMATVVDDGLMEWSTPVVEILPQFAVADPELTPKVEVQHLVCNCTGVSRGDLELLFNAEELTPEMVVESLETLEIYTGFGEAFNYNNQMVATGGYVAAVAAGSTGDLRTAFANKVQARVFDPIGMPNTTPSLESVLAGDDYAVPYGQNLNMEYAPLPVEYEDTMVAPVVSAGGIWSTASDMARYLITELNKGVGPDGNRVVSEENLQKTWEPQVQITSDSSYGMGWFVADYKGQRLLHHGGATLGFTSDLAFLPEAGIGITILSNARASSSFNQSVRYRVLEMAFDQPYQYHRQAEISQEVGRTELTGLAAGLTTEIDSDVVEPYLGKFYNQDLGEVEIRMEDGRLILDSGGFPMELRPEAEQTPGAYRLLLYHSPAMNGVPVAFQEGEDGQPEIKFGYGSDLYLFEKMD